MSTTTSTIEETQSTVVTEPYEPGDHERMSHYVDKNDALLAAVEGVPIRALCGKTWVPTRDGTKFPLCPECEEIYNLLPPD